MPVDGLHSLVDIVDQTVAFRVQMSNAVQRPLCNVIIEPDIAGLSSVDFSQGLEWVRRGHDAALAHRIELQAIADSARRLRAPSPARRPLPDADSGFVRRVGWSKVSAGADAIAQGAVSSGTAHSDCFSSHAKRNASMCMSRTLTVKQSSGSHRGLNWQRTPAYLLGSLARRSPLLNVT